MTGDYKTLSRAELETLAGEPLPDRAAMSLVNANLAIPVNVALAANVLSDNARSQKRHRPRRSTRGTSPIGLEIS
jgi:hypothetical protein